MLVDSEFRAYSYIEQVLADLGWNTSNPARGGDVYTQGEFRKHDPVLREALGLQTPENIVLIPWDGGYRYWTIEAKPKHSQLGTAIEEARDYAETINQLAADAGDGIGLARFATGIAGTPDESFFVTTEFWNGKDWSQVAINEYDTTGFLSLDQCADILRFNSSSLAAFDDDPERFLIKANAINKTLQRNEIPVGHRAHIIAALLLALAQDGSLRIHRQPRRLIREINGLIEDILKKHGKEDFGGVIKLTLPATEKNHKKYRMAIVSTLQHLREMNIRSAINAADDALGTFYETFLKYANGAKEMGIVLTPRHITRFAVDAVGVGPSDVVYDPACGTGGFLIAAMEAMREQSQEGYTKFGMEGIYGIEQRDDVYGLALVNMIFRGDGKSHVEDGDCFDHEYWLRDGRTWWEQPANLAPQGATRPFSRVLMNPPFKLSTRSEADFVDYALRQTKDGGILFAVLPFVVVGGKRSSDWRKRLLKRHTLLACVKFDKNLFYPVAEATYGIIVRAHEPMVEGAQVFMGSLFDDSHRPRRSKMLSQFEMQDNVERMTRDIHRFVLGQPLDSRINREQQIVRWTPDDECDLSPEHYLHGGQVKVDTVARTLHSELASRRVLSVARGSTPEIKNTAWFRVEDIIEGVETPRLKTLKQYQKGTVPVVSAAAKDNGISAWLDVPDEFCFTDCITVSLLHNTKPCQAFWHPYRFAALEGKALVLRPRADFLHSADAIIYLCEAITSNNAWRYHYARSPRLEELGVELPCLADGGIDLAAMAGAVRSQMGIAP